ncbi:MAG: hypothetical protein IKU84_02425, partial [Clostridia bacterium]|nr:hypothetical protein [Clostridia bacterium]
MKKWTDLRRVAKSTALRCLHGNYLKGVIASLIVFIAGFFALSFMPLNVPDTVNYTDPKALLMSILPEGDISVTIKLLGISILLFLLLSAPLSIGVHRYYIEVAMSKKAKFSTIFTPFLNMGEIFSSCALVILSTLWKFLVAVVFFALPFALLIFSPTLGPLAQIAGFLLYIAAAIFALVFLSPCTMAPFFLAHKPELGALRSLILAYKKMRGRKREFLIFDLSFILWRV